MAREPAPIPSRRVLKRLLLLGSSVGVALLLGEIVLRVLGVPTLFASISFRNGEFEDETYMVKDPELFWRLKHDAKDIHVNRLRLRGWAPSGPRGANDLRIACVGDSCTFGWGVAYEETYGMQLESILRRALPGARVETVLAAVPGYSTWQNEKVFESTVRPLRPDITVLYVGAYNDYLGAVGRKDSDIEEDLRALRDNPIYASRIARLIHVVATRREPDLEAFRRGEFADGPRVPLAEFEANVCSMIAMGRADGGVVLGVIPPLPASTVQRIPSALEYRAALRDIYSREGVGVVDAAALFEATEARLPADWRPQADRSSILFMDFVHPSPCGHALIARALGDAILAQESGPIAGLRSALPSSSVRIESVQPRLVGPLSAEVRVELRGSGFGSVDRVWVGKRWVRAFELVDDGRIVFALPDRITRTPGEHPVSLVTEDGCITGAAPLEVPGMPLQARMAANVARPSVEILIGGPPGAKVRVWLATQRRPRPFPTINGVVELPGDLRVGLPELEFAPFRWESLGHLPAFDGVVAENGRLHRVASLPEVILDAPSREIFVQGVVVDGEHRAKGVLTVTARVPVPR